MASTCRRYRLQSPVRSHLELWQPRVSQPRDTEQSSRQSFRESHAVPELLPHLSGPAVVHVQAEKQQETIKIALEDSSGTSSCAPIKEKTINQRIFRSLVVFPVLFNFSAFWTGTRINMAKVVQIATLNSPDPSSLRGDWRKISCAQSLFLLTQYKHIHSGQVSNIYLPSELLYSFKVQPLSEGPFFKLFLRGSKCSSSWSFTPVSNQGS